MPPGPEKPLTPDVPLRADETEPPYGIILNGLQAGQVVPFLGAGASFVGRPAGDPAPWDPETSSFLPSGGELAEFLAREASFPSQDPHDRGDLGKVASYYADRSGRKRLRERLRKLLNRGCQPGRLHHFLARQAQARLSVVTNYDTLLEQAFEAAGREYHLVVYPADRKDFANAVLWWAPSQSKPEFVAANELGKCLDLEKDTVIYKMHGTIGPENSDWDNFVITEDDYVEFLSRMIANTAVPSLFYEYFRERSFLFLGYSLRDWNLRVVLKNLSKHLAARQHTTSIEEGGEPPEIPPSWAMQWAPSTLERKLWERRQVEIYAVAVDDFVRRLSEEG
jgi:hypothetical protein